VQQYTGERSGIRTPASDQWALPQVRGAEVGSPGASPVEAHAMEDALAMPWAGAFDREDRLDDTVAFASPYRAPDGPPDVREPRTPHGTGAAGRGAQAERPNNLGTTTLRLGPRLAAGLSYLLWWFSGLIIYFNERENRYVRFHAVQSILLTSLLTIGGVIAYMLSSLLGDAYANTHQLAFRQLSIGVGLLAAFGILILWLAPMIAAWSGETLRIPILGRYAERFAAAPAHHDDD
jgi:uncharacterized membrane protein